jgi:hypothetical protein
MSDEFHFQAKEFAEVPPKNQLPAVWSTCMVVFVLVPDAVREILNEIESGEYAVSI